MQDEVGLVIQQPLPGACHRFDLQVEPRARAAREEAPEQIERARQRAKVTDHDAQARFFAHCQLLGMSL
jgi:hypothetical protein